MSVERSRLGQVCVRRVSLKSLCLLFKRWMWMWRVQRGRGPSALRRRPLLGFPGARRPRLPQCIAHVPVPQTLECQGLVQVARRFILGGGGRRQVCAVVRGSLPRLHLSHSAVSVSYRDLGVALLDGNKRAAGFRPAHFDTPWLARFSPQHQWAVGWWSWAQNQALSWGEAVDIRRRWDRGRFVPSSCFYTVVNLQSLLLLLLLLLCHLLHLLLLPPHVVQQDFTVTSARAARATAAWYRADAGHLGVSVHLFQTAVQQRLGTLVRPVSDHRTW